MLTKPLGELEYETTVSIDVTYAVEAVAFRVHLGSGLLHAGILDLHYCDFQTVLYIEIAYHVPMRVQPAAKPR